MRIKATPEDFVVEEVPLYPPSGVGGHTFLRVEKRGLTTEQVAGRLARAAGVRPRDVGYAGRKDKHAVTRQWLSVPGFDPASALAFEAEGLRVLDAVPHGHKLRTGQLRANRFDLVVRDVSAEVIAVAPVQLAALVAAGMPNRYGEQRFRDAAALEHAREMLGGAATPRDRRAARFALSVLQSLVFNQVLARRPLALGALEPGDVAWVHASGAAFLVEDLQREAPRAAAFEISASGPIFGTRLLAAEGAPGARERAVFDELGIPQGAALRPPRGIRLRGARRPLRVRPVDASAAPEGADALRLRFELPPGSFATVLVEELLERVPAATDGAREPLRP